MGRALPERFGGLGGAVKHRHLLLAGILAAALSFSACSDEDADPASVEHSFITLIGAIEGHDAETMWALTSISFRQFCEELHRELSDAERLVRLYFPEWEHERLLQRLAWHRLGGTLG